MGMSRLNLKEIFKDATVIKLNSDEFDSFIKNVTSGDPERFIEELKNSRKNSNGYCSECADLKDMLVETASDPYKAEVGDLVMNELIHLKDKLDDSKLSNILQDVLRKLDEYSNINNPYQIATNTPLYVMIKELYKIINNLDYTISDGMYEDKMCHEGPISLTNLMKYSDMISPIIKVGVLANYALTSDKTIDRLPNSVFEQSAPIIVSLPIEGIEKLNKFTVVVKFIDANNKYTDLEIYDIMENYKKYKNYQITEEESKDNQEDEVTESNVKAKVAKVNLYSKDELLNMSDIYMISNGSVILHKDYECGIIKEMMSLLGREILVEVQENGDYTYDINGNSYKICKWIIKKEKK